MIEKHLQDRFCETLEKEDNRKILFSDEKIDIDEVYNSQNDHIWAVSGAEADKRDAVKKETKISIQSNGLLSSMFERSDTIGHTERRLSIMPNGGYAR